MIEIKATTVNGFPEVEGGISGGGLDIIKEFAASMVIVLRDLEPTDDAEGNARHSLAHAIADMAVEMCKLNQEG